MSFMDNDLTTGAAAASYFSMLALFPTLLVLLALGNRVFGPETVEKYVIGQVLAFLPGAQTFVRKNLESISTISTGIIVSCLGVMLWAASWMFTVIEKALNRAW
jgi:membrane protein